MSHNLTRASASLREIQIKQQRARKGKRSLQKERLAMLLKWSSSLCAMLGGILVASNTSISGFGFIGLAASSFQMLLANLLLKDKTMVVSASPTVALIYRGNTYERKLSTPKPYQKPRAINWRWQHS